MAPVSFTVVIPNLHSLFIDQTLDSLGEQRYDLSLVEVIVVGQDEHDLVKENELVRFDRSPTPLAPAVARNRGIEQASGDVIAFLDADCLASPTWLAVLAERYRDSATHVVGGAVDFARDNYWSLADNVSMFHDYMVGSPEGERTQLPSLNLSARRQVFDEVGRFDERYPRPAGEDADLTIRMRKAGFTLHFEPRAVVHHHPPRHRPSDLVRHSFYQGRYSTKVDPRHAAQEGLPWFLRTRLGLVLGAPLLAGGVAWRIFAPRRDLWYYWWLLPAIYLSKVTWCVGAATHPDWS
jgi:glycosyltransferase involved in cell wall biosynthesis